MRASAVTITIVLLASATAGCLNAILPGPLPATPGDGPAWSMELPVTINVVLVGTNGRVDPARLEPGLIQSRPVFNLIEFSTTRSVNLEPIQYKIDWKFHEAPEAFTKALFTAAKAAAFEGPAPDWLVNYDRDSGQNRFPHAPFDREQLPKTFLSQRLPHEDAKMKYIDAPTLETWMHEHRADYGLAFPEPEYTVFVLDAYTDAYLPQNEYHYYYFDDGTIDARLDRERSPDDLPLLSKPEEFHTPKDPTSNRGWGGKYGFAWIDLGAAPSWMDNTPFYPAFEDDNVDHPVWDLKNDPAKLHRNLARHLKDFALVKVVRTPIYDFEYQPKWAFPVNVFVEDSAVSGKNLPMYGVDVETWLIPDRIEKAFEDLAPWVDTHVSVTYHHLPTDDAGMAEAVRKAKAYGSPALVNAGVIKEHIRANWDQYVPAYDADTRVFPQFLFYFDGAWTFWGPNQGGGFADGDGWGRPWVALNHIFDVCAKIEEFPCTKATKWKGAGTMDMLVIHEGGHHVGLTHARDTGLLADDQDSSEYYANWFWDSVWSVMTYRHQNPGFDKYDHDTVARGHAAWTLDLTARRILELDAAGTHKDAIKNARQAIARTETLLRAGAWDDAARAAIAAWENIKTQAGPLGATPLKTTPESFADQALLPVAPGDGGFAPVPFPSGTPGSAWETTFDVKENAAYLHMAYRDTRPEAGALRMAGFVVLGPDGKLAGYVQDDIFAEAYVTKLRGPGTYKAILFTNGGAASEYALTLDVHYPDAPQN